ncbi:MAG TPA: hypothetical protein VGF24_11085 [Vicinamibacterales bacterium]|jgi:hypothetical protein
MALTSTSSGLAVAETIEFVGIGPAGKRRTIDSFEYIQQSPLNRVNAVAPPGPDWMTLFNEWSLKQSLHVSLTIRQGNVIVLRLNDVIPLYFGVKALDMTGSNTARALMSFGSRQSVVAMVQPVIVPSLDRYLPASVRNGTPLQRIG